MKASPHCHPESALTGSTIGALVKRAKDLGRSHFVHTDLGHLSAAVKSYMVAKKAGLKPVLGFEFFFKDEHCPFTHGTKADRCRYYTASIYAQDQAAYQELVKAVSRDDLPKMELYEEFHSLWNWDVLEHLSKFNVQIVLSGVHCMVSKNYLAEEPKAAMAVFEKLKSLFGDRLSVAILAEPWSKKFASVVNIEYTDGTHSAIMSTDTVSTDRARKINAIDIVERPGHTKVKSLVTNNTFYRVDKEIKNATLRKGFLPLGIDASLGVNKFLYALAAKFGVRVLATDYAYYAEASDKVVQSMVLGGSTQLAPTLHMKTEDEVTNYLVNTLRLSAEESKKIIENNGLWAEQFNNFSLKYEWRLPDPGGDPMELMIQKIKEIGRMNWSDATHVARLKEELEVIAKNPIRNLTPYFLTIAEIMDFYKKEGHLAGPGRGSAGGSFLAYLMGITNVDPLKYELSFPRFLSMERLMNGDIPDIDSDFGSRDPLVGKDGKSGYLYSRWPGKVAQVSTRHTVRLKSAVKDVNRYFNGSVEPAIEVFSKGLPDPVQGVSDHDLVFGYTDADKNPVPGLIETSEDLQKYAAERPKEWDIVKKALGIVRANSQHASAFLISDIPISDVLPVKNGNIAAYEAKQCEFAGQIKFDLLVVKNILDVEECLRLINKKNGENHEIGYFTHNGQKLYIWDMPQDLEAMKSVWGGNTETVFQINTESMIPFVRDIKPENVDDLSTILALVRPGPLDYIDPATGRSMAEEYVWRRQGRSKPDFQELYDLIPETEGVIVFQEQSLKISKELGGMTPADAEKLRRLFSKKLKKEANEMKPTFMATAIPKVGEEKANKIWDMMETSSRYSFNKSHSMAYALISYACIFLKHYYPLEWWAAILTNAEEKEISGKLWQYVKEFVAPPDINLSEDTMVVDYANHKLRSKLGVIRGLGEKTIEPIVAGKPYKDIQDYVNKGVAGQALSHKLIHVGFLDSLFPPKSDLHTKLKMYEDALEIKIYKERVEKAAANGKLVRDSQPRRGEVPYAYTKLDPITNASMIKSTLPSFPMDTTALGLSHSKARNPTKFGFVKSSRGYDTLLVDGERLRLLDEKSAYETDKDEYVASTAFVIESKEFAYGKTEKKKALKIIIDVDGYVSEKVLWPDYNTGQLVYPETLKKGAIATFFFRKRANKQDMSIMQIVVES